MTEYKKLLAVRGLTDKEIAEMFGYKSHLAWLNSSARLRIITGIVQLIK